jgi:hypothetical protein
MPRRADGPPRLMRIVEGVRGRVPMRMELVLRPDYASITPRTEPVPDGAIAIAGPDAFRLSTPLPLQLANGAVTADFAVLEGARERFTLTWHASFEQSPPVEDARLGAGSHGGMVAVVERAMHVPGALPRRGWSR